MAPTLESLDVPHHVGNLLTVQIPSAPDLVRISRAEARDDSRPGVGTPGLA